jgi:hypothetical protein
MAPLNTAGTPSLFRATSEGPGVFHVLSSHHAFSASRAPHLPIPHFPLCRQNTSTIRDRQRDPCDALIYFLRFLRFLRNDLSVNTSDWGRWLDRVKDAHAQSKSSSRLPSLCSTQRHNGALQQIPPYYYGRETCVPGIL